MRSCDHDIPQAVTCTRFPVLAVGYKPLRAKCRWPLSNAHHTSRASRTIYPQECSNDNTIASFLVGAAILLADPAAAAARCARQVQNPRQPIYSCLATVRPVGRVIL
jgi:hypothetical protein